MIDRKKLQHLTDFNRRKIQELHNIVANNKNKQGVTYLYSDEEVNKFLLAKFLLDSGCSNRDIEDYMNLYAINKNEAISKVIKIMESQSIKLEKDINIANAMLNSNESILDISNMFETGINYSFDVLTDLYIYYSSYTDDVFSNISYMFENDGIFDRFIDFIDDVSRTYKENTFDYDIFRTNIINYINDISENIGVFSVEYLNKSLLEFINTCFDKEFYNFVSDTFNSYFKEMEKSTIEYKCQSIIESILGLMNDYPYSSNFIQDKVAEYYDLFVWEKIFGADPIDEIRMKSKMLNSVPSNNSLCFEEEEQIKFLADAFKYFVDKNSNEKEGGNKSNAVSNNDVKQVEHAIDKEINLLEKWQIVYLKKYNNTLISVINFNKKISHIYEMLYGEKINVNSLYKKDNIEALNVCRNYFKNNIKKITGIDIDFIFIPSKFGFDLDCYLIEKIKK